MKVKGIVDRIEENFFVIRSSGEDILVPMSLFPGLSEGEAIVISVKRVENKKVETDVLDLISEVFDEKDKE